jgi:hypothetical protein
MGSGIVTALSAEGQLIAFLDRATPVAMRQKVPIACEDWCKALKQHRLNHDGPADVCFFKGVV